MTATQKLLFRRLDETEKELAGEFLAAAAGWTGPKAERFGLAAGGSPAGEAWGLFIRESLCGLAWLASPTGGAAEVTGLVVARNWWRAGLAGWMLEELTRAASLAGAADLLVRVAGDGGATGEILADAGFSGPDPEDETFPDGEWRRSVRTAGRSLKGG